MSAPAPAPSGNDDAPSSTVAYSAEYVRRCRIDPRPPRPATLPLSSGDPSNGVPGVEIVLLADRMDLLPIVAGAYFAEWQAGYERLCDVHSAEACATFHAGEYCSLIGAFGSRR